MFVVIMTSSMLILSLFQSVTKINMTVIYFMMIMMNCFGDIIDRQKAFSLISSGNYCRQRSLTSRIFDPPLAGFESAQNLILGFI